MMTKRWLLRVWFLFAISGVTFAQSWPAPAGAGASTPFSGVSAATRPDKGRPRPAFLSGRVVVSEGMPLPQPATIVSSCNGQLHTEGYTDSKGYFSFELNGGRQLGPNSGETFGGTESVDLCELQADLPGFVSEKVQLSSNSDSAGVIRSGNIVLHPLTQAEGNMISAVNSAAPSKAQKEFQKGCEEARKGKWDAARERFEKAVAVYPKYAEAWLDLGRVQVQQRQFDAARQSFQQALSADSKLVGAYSELAELALREKDWQEVADATDHILQLDPVGLPQYWYLNSAANYEMKKVDKAEKSVLQGLRVDVRNVIPKMQYLLAAILAFKKDYRGAAEHIRSYLRLVPHAQDAAVAQQQLQQLEKLSGAAE